MQNSYEHKAEKRKAWSTLGYGIMWFFVTILIGFLPFETGNDHSIFYVAGGGAALVSIYKVIKGVNHISSL